MNRRWIVIVAILALMGIVGAAAWQASQQKTVPVPSVTTPEITSSQVAVTLVAKGLSNPVGIVTLAQDNRLFVLERDGVVRVVTNSTVAEEPFIDLAAKVMSDEEMGLLGMAFHPDPSDGRVFFNYIDKDRNTIIASFKTDRFQTVDMKSEKILIKLAQPYVNHNGGDIQFGADGYLYIALGDGGSGGDPQNRAQNLDNFFGKILRININSSDPYSIPAHNPFVNKSGAKKEIWAYGLRNPWRFSFDKQTQDLWIADVGQGEWEEVNHIAASSAGGLNFGWRCYEGNDQYEPSGCLAKENYVFPILTYDHSEERCSITGGYVYRGANLQKLQGRYIYADYCSGQLYAASSTNNLWQAELLIDTPYQPTAFGQDNNGELYFTDFGSGTVYALTVSK